MRRSWWGSLDVSVVVLVVRKFFLDWNISIIGSAVVSLGWAVCLTKQGRSPLVPDGLSSALT